MGDRSNIVIVQHGWDGEAMKPVVSGLIYNYFHWLGEDIRDLVVEAIEAAKGRWGDEAYATRIAMTTMFGGWDGDTGAGVALSPQDNEHAFYVVDFTAKTVALLPRFLYEGTTEEIMEAIASGDHQTVAFAEIGHLPPLSAAE